MKIELSWPEPCLWPNRRDHWSVVGEAKRQHRWEAQVETKRALVVGPYLWDGGEVRLSIVGHKPNVRTRDLQNLQAALKAAVDGIADALGVDDKHFVLTTIWGDNKPPRGGVTVEL